MKDTILILLLIGILGSCQQETKQQGSAKVEEDKEVTTALSLTNIKDNKNLAIGPLKELPLFNNITCNGRIDIPPADLVSLHAKTEGYITSIRFLPGQYVKQGTTIATLEAPQLLEKQRLMLETKADYLLAEKEYVRKSALVSKEATSAKQFDEALARRDRLKASYLGIKKELSVLGINTQKLEDENTYQSVIYIAAPTSGFISTIDVNKGQFVSSQNRLAQLTSDHHLHLELNVFEKDAHLLQKGQKVTFTTNKNTSTYTAEIVHINPLVNAESGTIGVHCHFDMKPELRAGMYVKARIKTDEKKQLAIPVEATVLQGDTYLGYKAEGDYLVAVELENAERNGDWITSPSLTTADQWLIKGAYYVGADDTEAGHDH
jgi:cobalt-zinc-cadmium efflux system membrane fusion protein